MLCNYPLLLLNGFVLLILLAVTVRSNSMDLWSKDYDQTWAMNSTANVCSEGADWLGPARQRSWPQADEIVPQGTLNPVPGRFPRNPKQRPLEVYSHAEMFACVRLFAMICLPIKSKLDLDMSWYIKSVRMCHPCIWKLKIAVCMAGWFEI